MEFWLFCVILGAVMFFGAAPIAKIKTRNCTRTVEMTIVGAVKHEPDPEDEGAVATYAPVYHFEMDGQVYEFERKYSSSAYPDIGHTTKMFVNPECPAKDYCIPDSKKNFILLFRILGVVSALSGWYIKTHY